MKDRRTVDELSIEELEEILRTRKRQERISRMRKKGRAASVTQDPLVESSTPAVPHPVTGRPPMQRSAGAARYTAKIDTPVKRKRSLKLHINWGWIGDRLLLLVEILAVAGLLFVILKMSLTINELNEDSLAAYVTLEPTPTPLIRVAVLPGGHTPPDVDGQSEPAQIPAHLRDLVEAITPLPVPTPGPEQARRIVIPAIGVDAPVVDGDDWETLKKGVGHHIGSANPGERGNCVLSAHNDIYGEIFRELPELRVGDVVQVETTTQTYRYVVRQTRIIEPTEVSVMDPTSSPVLTLISCYPYGVDTHRIVVIAELEL
ncbi:MAG: class D sortase [Anaerolineae bacterium]|nr:class D sortase [Anaerolineae bacterium]